jgi:hypothetical protein
MSPSELATLYRSPRQRNADLLSASDVIALQIAQDIEEQAETFMAFLRAAQARADGVGGADISEFVNMVEDNLADAVGSLWKVRP